MDYFSEAFDGFRPDRDIDAALKFSLCMIAIDNRVEDLLQLIEVANNLGGVEGDPGWIIERRENGETIGYEKWPNSAHFREPLINEVGEWNRESCHLGFSD
ncbi:hypothetical protein [Ralstonia solanacearum]|nr:hypothetical protein [Ralstonia solanacearum]